MLDWENFIIKHEKMKKLREDIVLSFSNDTNKLAEMELKIKDLKHLL